MQETEKLGDEIDEPPKEDLEDIAEAEPGEVKTGDDTGGEGDEEGKEGEEEREEGNEVHGLSTRDGMMTNDIIATAVALVVPTRPSILSTVTVIPKLTARPRTPNFIFVIIPDALVERVFDRITMSIQASEIVVTASTVVTPITPSNGISSVRLNTSPSSTCSAASALHNVMPVVQNEARKQKRMH